MTARVLMRSRSRETASGFCNGCGIWRQDVEGVPVVDCICTALMNHSIFCFYVKAVSMWFVVEDCKCTKHGDYACEECDCTCGLGAVGVQTDGEPTPVGAPSVSL
jgi:hypothetical protein